MPDVPPTLQEKLALMGLPQAYRSILLSLSTTAPPSTLASKKQIYLHAAAVLQSLSATHNSASKIQSITRGKTARKSVSVKKLDNARQSDAAIKLQSIQRGRQGRYHHLNERKKRDDFAKVRMQAEQHVAEQKEQHLATTKLQAIQRGRMGRKESIRKKDDKHSADVNGEKGAKAATILQNVHRRKSAVAITSKMKEEKELEAGARKIQSLQRARTGKKEFEEKQGAVAKLQAAERGRMGRKKAKAATSEYKSAAILQARKRGADGRVEARQVARARAMEPVGDGMIHIGDVVKARIAGEPLWCEGIVIGRSGEGNIEEFDIDFGDGEVQEHVPMKSIRKIFHWSTLEIGDHVKAPVPGFAFMKADAEVVVYEGDAGGVARYTIKFDDGEIAEGVPVGDLIKATSSRTKAVLMWRKGFQTVMAVSAFTDKKWGAYRRLSTVGAGGGLPGAVGLPGFQGALAQRRGSKEGS